MGKSTTKKTATAKPTLPVQPINNLDGTLPVQLTNDPNELLPKEKQVDILLAEYNRLSAEIRMFIEQFTPKFTVFAIFVLSGFTFALQNPSIQFIYIVLPFFVYLIGYASVAQGYILSSLVGRIRSIEERIKVLNGGVSILEWESKFALKLFFPPLVRIKLVDRRRRLIMPNPIFLSVVFIILAVMPIVAYSTWRTYQIILYPWNVVYTAFVVICFIGISIQSFSYFVFGLIMDKIDHTEEKKV